MSSSDMSGMPCVTFDDCKWLTSAMLPDKPRTRIELHVHMDGAVRLTTIWELSKLKGLELPGDGSLEALKEAIVCSSPSTLCNFLNGIKWITPILIDDLESVERIAYELCEDKAKDGVMYFELRYSPHLLVSGSGTVTTADVVRRTLVGLRRGELDFSIKARLILCCMRFQPEKANEVLELCDHFRDEGVVGIDLAGDEAADVDVITGIETFHPLIIETYQEAFRRGIHRTAHVGEAGPANGVETAIDVLKIQRLGHGYHTVLDVAVYDRAKSLGIHFETCPYSSVLTGSVPKDWPKHPIVTFAEDGINFSISTDDPSITASTLTKEYQLLYDLGLTEAQVIRANFNAIHSSFLKDDEKIELATRLIEEINVYRN